tara:strand:+ start:203 stop:499 length:297 start_codon:yes stop_codon:yes gene_type:complete
VKIVERPLDKIRESLKKYIEGDLVESAKLLNLAHLAVYEGCMIYRDIPFNDCIDIMEYLKLEWPMSLEGELKYIRTLQDMNRAIEELCIEFVRFHSTG